MSFVTCTRQGTTAVITLNRPDRLNAISDALLADLQRAIAEAESFDDVRAIVLHGQGRAFCAGEDLKEFNQVAQTEHNIRHHVAALQDVTRAMRNSRKIYIVAAHGYAVGGGLEWMINGDLVVAADDLIAFFPEMERALFPTGGVSWILPMSVGYHRAMQLMLLGERQTALQLQQAGLVNWVVRCEELLDKALAVAAHIAATSALSVALFKKLLNQDLASLDRVLDLEAQYTIETFRNAEALERARGFKEKKQPGDDAD